MNNQNENQEAEAVIVSPAIIFEQSKAEIDMQITTAKAYPRSVKRSMENAIAIVTMDKETAAVCSYALPRGGKPITGPSVHLAKILAQTWGNMRVDSKVVSIDQTHVTSQSVAFDLENNLAIKVEVKRRITDSKGKRFNDDMITVTGNAANSIALRNAVLAVIPRAIVEKVYNEAQRTITGDLSDKTKLIAKRKQVFDGFKELYKLEEIQVLSAVGKAAIDHVTADDIAVLIGIGQAIKDGDTTVEQAFFNKKETLKEKLKEDLGKEGATKDLK
jgi:hypothetical protein